MRQWLALWGGHVVVTLGCITLGAAGYIMLEAARAIGVDRMFFLFTIGALTALFGLAVVALGTYVLKNPYQRWYYLNQRRLADEGGPYANSNE